MRIYWQPIRWLKKSPPYSCIFKSYITGPCANDPLGQFHNHYMIAIRLGRLLLGGIGIMWGFNLDEL